MKKIEVYTMNNCSYCEAAKSLLKSMDLPFTEFNVGDDHEKRLELVNKTGHRTMPQIFIDGQFVGGYRELKEYLSNEE